MSIKYLPRPTIPLEIMSDKPATFQDVVKSLSEFLGSDYAQSLSTDLAFHLTELQKHIEWASDSRLETREKPVKTASEPSETPKKKKKREAKEDAKPKKAKKQRHN